MKYMVCWKIMPGNHKPAAEAFLKSGAPMPAGLTKVGRWHAPGSSRGWLLVEGDLKALAEHLTQWSDLLELEVSPVLEDADAGEAMATVYAK